MPAPALRDLQALFWRALSGSVEPALEAAVVSTPSLAAADRLGIYSEMYVGRLCGVLAEDFEKTAAALGDDGFPEAVRAYLAAHPSEHPSVRQVGRHFASFLASRPPPGGPPWLADLARLEWARVEVFDAPDATPLRLADLRGAGEADWPGLRLLPIAALEVVSSPWPLHVVWREGGAPGPGGTAKRRGPRSVLRVWRQEGVVYHCAMDPLERAALARMRAGATFGEICETLAHFEPGRAAAEAAALLARWVEDGLIAAVA